MERRQIFANCELCIIYIYIIYYIYIYIYIYVYVLDCPDTFEHVEQTGTPLGTGHSAATDLVACQAMCLVDNDCYGLDWTIITAATEVRCWLHLNESFALTAVASTESDQYRRLDGCEGRFYL